MGQTLAFTVEILDETHHGPHRLADFAQLPVAISAAKHALDDRRVRMAVVRDRSGTMVYATDQAGQEWTG